MPRLAVILSVVLLTTIAVVFLVRTGTPEAENLNPVNPTPVLTTGAIEASATHQQKERVTQLLATAFNESLSWQDRVPFIEQLPNYDLDDAAIAELYAYLHTPPAQRPDDFYVVGNEIMEVLRENGIGTDLYQSEMLRLIEDPQADSVMRDYAIQHLTQWEALDPEQYPDAARPDLDLPADRDPARGRDQAFFRILDVIDQAENAQADFVGTALTSLRVGMDGGPFQQPDRIRGRLAEITLALASGQRATSPVNRLTAIQVAAELNLPEAVGISRQILASADGEEASVVLSAIAALGQVGDESDLGLLRTKIDDSTLQFAAKTAINRIESRL